MTAPAWLASALAGVMIATAVYCLVRMAAARRWQRATSYDIDSMHVLMGVAMAGMLAPRLNPLAGSGWARDGWAILFGLAAIWFGRRAVLGRRQSAGTGSGCAAYHLEHLLACGAMVYMFLARTFVSAAGMTMGRPGSAGLAGARVPALALGLAAGLLGYAVWTADRLTSLARVTAGQSGAAGRMAANSAEGCAQRAEDPGTTLAPMSARLSACCDIVMGVSMGYMLITML